MEFLLYLWPFALLIVLAGAAKIFELTRTTHSDATLGKLTRQGEIWAGLLQGPQQAVRLELRGDRNHPLASDLEELKELWGNRQAVVGEDLPHLVEVKSHAQHWELVFERESDQTTTKLLQR